jgi:hypothetical protein
MTRTFDAAFMNTVLNHPEVHPWTGYDGTIDITLIAENVNNYVLVNAFGGFIAYNLSPGVYEVHSMFLPEGRGKQLLQFSKECLEYMFTRTDCHTLVTQLPDNNASAISLATMVGFQPYFRRENTPRGPTAYARYTLDEWVQDTESLETEGEWFHSNLRSCKECLGSELPDHDHDPSHERAVGAAVKMIKAGNAFKAIDYYNNWAKLAGYAPVELLSFNPVVVDVVDAIVEIRDGQMEVLKCR